MIEMLLLGWLAYRIAKAMIDAGIAIDGLAARMSPEHPAPPRRPHVYETPTVTFDAVGGNGSRLSELEGGWTAGTHQTPEADTAVLSPVAPAAVLTPPPPLGTQPLEAVAAGSSGTGPVEGPVRSRRGRHESGRVLWFPDWLRWLVMRPIGATP